MTDLSANTPLIYSEDTDTNWYDYPVAASAHLYQGMPITKNNTTGLAQKLAASATDVDLLGFVEHEADNSGSGNAFSGATIGDGTAGNITVRARTKGSVIVSVAAGGVLAGSQADIDKTVYATDTNTYTGSSAANAIAVGKIKDWLGGTSYLVRFESVVERSI